MADEAVARFDILLAGCNQYNTHGSIEVCGNEQFELGRDVKCRYSWRDDLTISREHLRIHCILYEQDPVSDIAPFVYATDLSANGTLLKKSNAECTGSQGRGILMGKNGTFLLDDGDELRLSETVTLVYRAFGQVKQSILTQTQEREKAILSSRYLVTGRLLGEGGYGKVLIGIDQNTQRQLACKIVNLEKLYDRRADLRMPRCDGERSSSQAIRQLPNKVQSCFREFDILKGLSHPNIVHVQKVFWSYSTIYMFQELVTGGDLFSYIEYKHGKIPSIESAVIIRQVLKGVQYLHDQSIVHRDLKPDNILMTSLDNGARIVITDFGNARFLPNANIQSDCRSNKLNRMFSLVGTLEYTAPEIHKANHAIPKHYGYSLSVDMWSIGSITAAILTGEQIFGCRQDGTFEQDPRRVIIQLAAQCDLSVLDDEYHPLWGPIGPAPKDFIKRLLVLEEENRLSAAEALSHVWFTHPFMAAEFDAQYERSIKNWRPRHKDDQLIEQISSLKQDPVRHGEEQINAYDNKASSRFFAAKPTPTHNVHSIEHQHREDPQSLDRGVFTHSRFAGQLRPLLHDSSCIDDKSQNDTQQNGRSQDQGNCNLASHRALEEQCMCIKSAIDDPPIPQSTISDLDQIAAGRLQRVSTTTRGHYFEREIDNLDDLGGPSDERDGAGNSGCGMLFQALPHGSCQRENTVQVRTTPCAEDDAFGVDMWWYERYPRTQHYFGTQTEPVSQEEDSILVQETPPEVFVKPLRPSARKVLTRDDIREQQYDSQRVFEAFSVQNAAKRRKVYGRPG